MADYSSDYEPNSSGDDAVDQDDDMSGLEGSSDEDPLLSHYRARSASTAALAAGAEEDEADAGDEEPEEADDSVWAVCAADAERCKVFSGFTVPEVLELFGECEDALVEHVGRGKHSKLSKHDRLLMLLMHLRHYDPSATLAQTFGISKTHIQRTIRATAEAVAPVLWHCYVETVDLDAAPRFDEFPTVVAMMDATVQPIYAPEGAYDEKKRFFSGKHKIYCLKSQIIHDLRGLAIDVVAGVPGATHDVTIAQRHTNDIRRVVRPVFPRDPHLDVEDSDASGDEPEPARLIMVDSGYQGLQHVLPCVLPIKKRPNRPLTAAQKLHNRRVARRRVLVENYYGRMKQRHRIVADKYRGERDAYELFFKLCVALTNFHVGKYPLRAD